MHWRWPYLLLVVLGACSFDLVSPSTARRDTRLSVFLNATALDQGALVVSASLRPAVGEDGRVAQVADPRLSVASVRLRPDSAYEDGRLMLVWQDTVVLPIPKPETIILIPPEVRGGTRLDALSVPLRQAAGPGRGSWRPGDDIILSMLPMPADGEMPASSRWHLQVDGWLETSARIHLVSLDALAALPDTVRVLGAWLLGVQIDSLGVALSYDRSFQAANADSSYTASMGVAQRLEWRFSVERRQGAR